MSRLSVFAYASLVSPASAAQTLGRSVDLVATVRLSGWRRGWAIARDNLATEKTFARADDGSLPAHCLGLSLERTRGAGAAPADGPIEDADAAPNGALIEVSEPELRRLDLREMRYDRVEVTAELAEDAGRLSLDAVFAYVAKRANRALTPPPGAVIIAGYLETVELAFADLGPGQLELFRRTTGPPPVEVVEARLVRDEIPAGNPRGW